MWIKKINEYYETSSEYDNNGLLLHMAINLINMFKDRISFTIDEDCNVSIKVIKYGDMDDDYEPTSISITTKQYVNLDDLIQKMPVKLERGGAQASEGIKILFDGSEIARA